MCFVKAAGNVDAFGLTFPVELCLFSRTWKANGDVKIQGVVQAEAEQTSLCRTFRKRTGSVTGEGGGEGAFLSSKKGFDNVPPFVFFFPAESVRTFGAWRNTKCRTCHRSTIMLIDTLLFR